MHQTFKLSCAPSAVAPSESCRSSLAFTGGFPGDNLFASRALTSAFETASQSDSAVSAVAPLLGAYAREALADDLTALVRLPEMLATSASVSYLHGNGFYKIVLGQTALYKLRLHVWLPGVNAEENIHEHRWHFASTVLAGALHSEIYAEDVTPAAKSYDEYVYLAKEGNSPPGQIPVGKTRLACVRSSVRTAGDSYHMLPGVMHRIVRTNGQLTATLMCQSQPARRSNRLLTAPGRVPDVEQRYMTVDEVADVVRTLLNSLSSH